MARTSNPYEVLGVKPGASQDEIKSQYRKLVKQYHPDRYKGHPLEELAKEKMQEINEAYARLTSTNQNQQYYGQTGPTGQQQQQQNPYGYGPFGQNPYNRGAYQNRQNPYQQGPFGGTSDADCCNAISLLCCANTCLSCCVPEC